MDHGLVMIVFRVMWVVAMVDLMLNWSLKVVHISMMFILQSWMGRSSWVSVVELGVMEPILILLVVCLRMMGAPLVVWFIVAHVAFMISVNCAVSVMRLPVMIVIVVIIMDMNYMFDKSMESSLMVDYLMVHMMV